MSELSSGQVNTSAAEVYDKFFLPALFEQWAIRVADAAEIGPGQHVLDVACGTGILALAAAARVGNSGSVTGVDINEGMLAVAARKSPLIKWENARAESLPFGDSYFDRVVSQFGLMFFENQPAAISELLRVLKPGGCLVVAVWASLEETPGYASMVQLLERLFGNEVSEALRAPFCLGDSNLLRNLFIDAGLESCRVVTIEGTARFPSIESWIYTDIKGWTLADMIDDRQYEQLQEEARSALAQFVTKDGSVQFAAPAHLVVGNKD